jgi:hypothetical protein
MKLLSLLAILLNFTSCANYVRTIGTKMISPEARGKLGSGSVEFRYQAGKGERLDFSSDSTKNAMGEREMTHALTIMGELGLLSRFDIFLIPTSVAPSVFGAKFQVLGKPAAEAKQGNFSLSFYAGVGGRSGEGNADDFDLISGSTSRIKVDQDHREYGLIFGHRIFDRTLIYSNVIYLRNELKGSITESSGALVGQRFHYNLDGQIYSLGVIQYWKRSHLKLDYSHLTTDWTRTHKNFNNLFNVAYGWHW